MRLCQCSHWLLRNFSVNFDDQKLTEAFYDEGHCGRSITKNGNPSHGFSGLLVIRGTTEHGTAERRNEKQRNGIFFLFFFFFIFNKKNNNKQTVNISHKIKGIHIFFILRGRSRAKLSSLFRVRISRRRVTDCPSDLLAPIETMKRTKSKQVKKAVDKKIDGLEKLLSPQLKLVEASPR